MPLDPKDMDDRNPNPLAGLTPEQIERGRRWARNWAETGEILEQIRREELRNLNGLRALELLCGPADYTVPPRAPKPWSGIVEQQDWFRKFREREGRGRE